MDWKKCELIANVLANPPSSTYANTENYYKLICPQLLQLLQSDRSFVQIIACASIRAVTERSLILSRRYLLDVIMMPFIRLADKAEEEQALGITEDELDECVKTLYKVFVIGNDPSIVFLSHLERVMLVVLELHLSITFGVSHLKDPVRQLVNRFLKHSDRATSILALR